MKGRDKRKRAAKRKRETPVVAVLPEAPPAPPSSGDPYAEVGSRLRPRPHLGAGAIALPEPEDPEEVLQAIAYLAR